METGDKMNNVFFREPSFLLMGIVDGMRMRDIALASHTIYAETQKTVKKFIVEDIVYITEQTKQIVHKRYMLTDKGKVIQKHLLEMEVILKCRR